MKKFNSLFNNRIVLVFFVILAALFVSCRNYSAEEDYYSYFQNEGAAENITLSKDKSGNIVIAPNQYEDCFVFYPGAFVNYDSYLPLLMKIARQGILVIDVKMPLNMAILDANAASDFIKSNKYSQVKSWYVGGHSMGGAMAGSFASKNPTLVEGLILLAAYSADDLSDTNIRVLSVYGSSDGVLGMEKYEKNKANLPSQAFEEHVIEGGNHAWFGNYGEQNGDGKASVSHEVQQDKTAAYITNFIGK